MRVSHYIYCTYGTDDGGLISMHAVACEVGDLSNGQDDRVAADIIQQTRQYRETSRILTNVRKFHGGACEEGTRNVPTVRRKGLIGHSKQFPLCFERGPTSHQVRKKEWVLVAFRISDVINSGLGRLAHLSEIESVSVDASKLILILYLYLRHQVAHLLIPSNLNLEGRVGHPETQQKSLKSPYKPIERLIA